MSDFLAECDRRTRRPRVVQWMMPAATAKYDEDMAIMRQLATESKSQLLVIANFLMRV
jgi:hypothetical protein